MRSAPELAEAVGTFALVLAACGAIAVDSLTGAISHLGIAMAFGLVIAAMIYAVGHVSGAHFNPAVTIAFAATNHFPWRRVPSYIAAQVLGATLAAVTLRFLLPAGTEIGVTRVASIITPTAGLIVEVLLTAVLMFVIASVATDGRAVGHMAGLAIGGTVGLSALWAGPLTNASMNPARSIGPAIAFPEYGGLWMFIVAPIVGALIGAFVYELLRGGDHPDEGAPMKVLFVCVGNSCRSQMAEAVARHHGLNADSAGTQPASGVARSAIAVMEEAGIDASQLSPKMLDFDKLGDYARTITMGCGVAESCPSLHTDEDWGLDDPVGQPIEVFRETLADIERRVLALKAELVGAL